MSKNKRGTINRAEIASLIRRHNDTLSTAEMSIEFNCSETVIREIRRDKGIVSTVPPKRTSKKESEFLWEGVSTRLLSVPFINFGAEVAAIGGDL